LTKLRVALVGCGGSGSGNHAPAWFAVENSSLVAVCDLVEEKAKNLGEKYKVNVYTDLDKMLRKERPDILDVATKPPDHAPCAIKGLEAGCHVYCETPLATSSKEGIEMVRTAQKQGRFLGYNDNYSIAPHQSMLKEWVNKGELGTPCYILSVGHPWTYHHRIDLMLFFGGEVAEVFAPKSEPLPTEEGEGIRCRTALLKFESGAIGNLVAGGWKQGGRMPLWPWYYGMQMVEYFGTKGRVITHDIIGGLERYTLDQRLVYRWEPMVGERRDFTYTWFLAIRAFAKAVMEGREPPFTGVVGVKSLLVAEAMSKSAETNMWVKPEKIDIKNS